MHVTVPKGQSSNTYTGYVDGLVQDCSIPSVLRTGDTVVLH